MKRSLAWPVLLGLCLHGTTAAAADEESDAIPEPVVAVFAGAATAFASAAIGSYVLATADDRGTRNAAFLGMNGGIALAPLVSHAVTGEIVRGLFFSAVPALTTVALGECFAYSPNYLRATPAAVQWLTSSLLTLTILSAAIGVLDATRAADRRARRR